MKKLFGSITAVAAILALAGSAMCSSVVGLVSDQDRHFVNNAYITVTDSHGKTAGHGRSDIYGRYCIPLVAPGKYTVSIDPNSKDFQGGSAMTQVDIEGATINWFLSPTSTALATTDVGVASAATLTCGAPWWETTAAGAGLLVGAGGIVGGILCTEGNNCGSGNGGGNASPSR
ncbi:MAG TPA: carboxypeptidase-like regulatory domain-containing protein [Candidatus Binataceae bacterium]|nr:carboxypeptidase-like regulatory domain-containing protein [Candidatus Binataceae bacterium]